MRKIPMRSCVITKEKLPKQELIRVVKNNSGEVFIDVTGKANGRGCYLKKDIDVINKAEKTNILNRHLETEISKDLYDELRSIIIDK